MDVYSFGVLLMEMILHQPPPTTVRERQIEIESIKCVSFKSIVSSCLKHDHRARPPIGSVLNELELLEQ